MADYIPGTQGDLYAWLTNYSDKIATVGKTCGMSDDDTKALQDLANSLLATIIASDKALADSRKAHAAKKTQKKVSLTAIRASIAHLKASSKWTDAMSKDMQADTSAAAIDTATYKPKVTASVNSGAVQLRFFKMGVHAINIYVKLKGESTFTFLATVILSTYTDDRPLAVPGVAEARQYYVVGVMNDKEIGLPSDIITINFGG